MQDHLALLEKTNLAGIRFTEYLIQEECDIAQRCEARYG